MDYSRVHSWNTACQVRAELPLDTIPNCEGNPAESFAAGWHNAADMIDNDELDSSDNATVLRYVFHEFDNMGHAR